MAAVAAAGTLPRSDVRRAIASATIVHLANASYRFGAKQLFYDARGERVVNDDGADRLQDVAWRAPYAVAPSDRPERRGGAVGLSRAGS